jgi:2-polyprenyl-6-methoxyphenol hydroxylase-like FAD-dependent oxidoreductase
VEALTFDAGGTCATGARTADGREHAADLVVDAGGRRSPVRDWSIAAGFDVAPLKRVDCKIAYYTRYYTTLSDVDAPEVQGVETVDDGFMAHALAIADARTIGSIFIVPSSRSEFRALGSEAGWDAGVGQVARMAEVLDAAVRRPIMAPSAMYGLENALAPWQADGVHGPHRVAPVGDSWLVTNPNLAWGSSVALSQGFALADAIDQHGDDLDGAIDAYRLGCSEEVEQLFDEACATDRALHAAWLSAPWSTADIERASFLFGLARVAREGDLDVAERLERRRALLDLPRAVFEDPDLLAKARRSLESRPFDPDRRPVTIDEVSFLAALRDAVAG